MRALFFPAVVALLCCVPAAAAGGNAAREIVLDDCAYASSEAARKTWRPIQEDTPAMETARSGDGCILAFPCNFSKNSHWRVGWDRDGSWDLSDAREILLAITEPSGRGARMLMYFRSGEGWYSGSFSAPGGNATIKLSPKRFRIEGTPAGWSRIDGIRLCVLRDEAADGTVHVGKVWADVRASHVAVWRNSAGIEREGGVPEYVKMTADALDRLGLAYRIADDAAVAAGALKGKKVAILPLNPVMPKECAGPVRKFVAGGGKLVVCYCLPDPLGELLGMSLGGAMHGEKGAKLSGIVLKGAGGREVKADQFSWIARILKPGAGAEVAGYWTDESGAPAGDAAVTRHANGYFVGHVLTRSDPVNKDRLLMEMLGDVYADAWKEVCAHRLEKLGHAAGVRGVEELKKAIEKSRPNDARQRKGAREMALQADIIASRAVKLMGAGKTAEAADLLAKAQGDYIKAYAMSVSPRVPEMRAVWCHQATGVSGMTWEQAMKRLADNGINATLPNMLWGGGAEYESDVLPMVAEAREKGDQLAECVAAAKKHGIDVHVWKVNWRLWGNAPEAFRKKLTDEDRLQRNQKGEVIDWLCPSHPANLKLELDAMLEVARKYDVAGIHFDYIRYPGNEGCYCDGCRKRFEESSGVKAEKWPTDVTDGALREKYLQFRRDNITALVEAVSREARKLKPGIKVSAAVFWHWPSARNEVAQDWKLWIEKGYLDFVCPMQYTESAADFTHKLKSTMSWAGGRVPVVPGIGATLGLMPEGTLEQVLIARKHKAAGFVLFNYERLLADEHLPLLRLGATAPR